MADTPLDDTRVRGDVLTFCLKMAESFMCNGEFVHFSNGGGHEMMKEWSGIAASLGFRELSNSLEYHTQLGNGCCATGIDEEFLDERFSEPETKKQWIQVMDVFLSRLSDGSAFDGWVGEKFDSDLTESWIHRCRLLRSALASQQNGQNKPE